MLTGQGIHLIVVQQLGSWFSLFLVLCPGLPRCNLQYHAPLQKLSIGLATTAIELAWLRILFKGPKLFLYHVLVLWCHNVSAIALSANLVFHSRTKHIEVDYHFVCEKVLRRDLCVKFVLSKDNLADIFTKSLPRLCFFIKGANAWWIPPPLI